MPAPAHQLPSSSPRVSPGNPIRSSGRCHLIQHTGILPGAPRCGHQAPLAARTPKSLSSVLTLTRGRREAEWESREVRRCLSGSGSPVPEAGSGGRPGDAPAAPDQRGRAACSHPAGTSGTGPSFPGVRKIGQVKQKAQAPLPHRDPRPSSQRNGTISCWAVFSPRPCFGRHCGTRGADIPLASALSPDASSI